MVLVGRWLGVVDDDDDIVIVVRIASVARDVPLEGLFECAAVVVVVGIALVAIGLVC